jgi:photosystem II oxygen-evolving enhancer protein 2
VTTKKHTLSQQSQQAQPSRRDALAAAAAALVAAAAAPLPAAAAYGEAARVFGSAPTNATGFTRFEGAGFVLDIPAKYNPSRLVPAAPAGTAVVCNWHDNGDLSNELAVYATPAGGKASISAYGSPEAFLATQAFLFGDSTSFTGETRSEGGFAPNKIAAASLMASEAKTVDGKEYYTYEVLTRTQDGEEGGKHHLISAAVSNDGTLFVHHSVTGDKRFFKGYDKAVKGSLASFRVL